MVRKAFKQAETERPGATFLVLPEDVAERDDRCAAAAGQRAASTRRPPRIRSHRAAHVLGGARSTRWCWPVHGVARDGATDALIRFAERLNLPVATTFLGKGVFPDDHPNALGTIGFMVKDYANFGFDRADVVVAVGYDLSGVLDPALDNPNGDKRIIHIHRTVAEVDANYTLEVGSRATSAQRWTRSPRPSATTRYARRSPPVRGLLREELERGAADDALPAAPGADRRRHPRGAGPRRHRAGATPAR